MYQLYILVSINLRLICIYAFGIDIPLFSRNSLNPCNRTSPPLILIWELSNLDRYFYSFWYINSGIMRFCDTLEVSKCVWQVIRNVLQVNNPLHFKFRFFSTWIQGLNT